MNIADTARTNRRYSAIVALYEGATTPGERKAARAARLRMLNSPRHFRTLCGHHPLADIDGFSWEILEVLKSTWNDNGEDLVETVLLGGFDFKELRNALRTHRATMRAQWRHGRHVGNECLKRLTCQEWALQWALRSACRAEGMSADEAAKYDAGAY